MTFNEVLPHLMEFKTAARRHWKGKQMIRFSSCKLKGFKVNAQGELYWFIWSANYGDYKATDWYVVTGTE